MESAKVEEMKDEAGTRVDSPLREGSGVTTAPTAGAGSTVAQHTPGPWRWERPRVVYRIRGPRGEFILEGNQYHVSNGADARLIAAAPDLLVAARSALTWCEQGGPMDWALVKVWRDALQAAIEKAEGQ